MEDTIALTLDTTFTDTDTSLNLTAATPTASSLMGTSVAMAGRFVLAGAPGQQNARGVVEVRSPRPQCTLLVARRIQVV